VVELNLYTVVLENVTSKQRSQFLVAEADPSSAITLLFLKLDQTEGDTNVVISVDAGDFKVITPDESA